MSDESTQLLQQAREALAARRFEEALSAANRARDEDPNSAMAWIVAGIALSELGRSPEATDAFRQAISLDPSSSYAYFNLAMHQFKMNRHVEARAMVQEALRLEPGHAAARNLLANLESAATAMAPPVAAPPPSHTRESYSPYVRPGYQQSGEGVPFVRNMGAGWMTIGWILCLVSFVLVAFSIVLVAPQISEMLDQVSRDPNNRAAIEQIQKDQNPMTGVLQLLSMLTWAAALVWAVFDIMDRRSSWAWILIFICCYPLLAPIYFLAGRK